MSLTRTVQRLLVHDWAPNGSEGDKILYVFDCGPLGDDESRIQLDGSELDKVEWVPAARVGEFVIARLERRLTYAFQAYSGTAPLYLEHGQPR